MNFKSTPTIFFFFFLALITAQPDKTSPFVTKCYKTSCYSWDDFIGHFHELNHCDDGFIPAEIYREEMELEILEFVNSIVKPRKNLDIVFVPLNMDCSRETHSCHWISNSQDLTFQNWKDGLDVILEQWEDESLVYMEAEGNHSSWIMTIHDGHPLALICMRALETGDSLQSKLEFGPNVSGDRKVTLRLPVEILNKPQALSSDQGNKRGILGFLGFDFMDNKFLLNLLIFNVGALVVLLLIAAYVLLVYKSDESS